MRRRSSSFGCWGRLRPGASMPPSCSAGRSVARLEDLRIRALELRIDADLALGLGADLVSELEALTAEHPFRERLCAQLMTALYKAGRQADALTALRRTRRVLREELGLDPGPDLRE